MFYTWKEFSKWINVTLFEIWMFLGATFIFTIILPLKLENPFNIMDHIGIQLTWLHVFIPYFIFDCLSAYFNIIIFIRQYHTGKIRQSLIRLISVICRLSLFCSVKIFLIYRLELRLIVNYSEIFLPLFFLLFFLICRSFRI